MDFHASHGYHNPAFQEGEEKRQNAEHEWPSLGSSSRDDEASGDMVVLTKSTSPYAMVSKGNWLNSC